MVDAHFHKILSARDNGNDLLVVTAGVTFNQHGMDSLQEASSLRIWQANG